jgi:hypothetical protein
MDAQYNSQCFFFRHIEDGCDNLISHISYILGTHTHIEI